MAQIADRLNISFSAVRYCLDRNDIKRRNISDAITNLHRTKFHRKPFQLKQKLSKKDLELRIAGAMLYWGEGNKSGGTVKFTNSDYMMIKVFLKFLREICGVEKKRIKALVHLYPDHDEKKIVKFWSSVTEIPVSRFYPSYIHQGGKGTYRNKSLYGTLALSYSDKKLLGQILSWIEEYKEKLS